MLVACPFYWAFAGAIDFDFDDGSLESWTLDEVRDGNTGAYYGSGNLALSWDDATQYPGAPNLYPHGDALGDFLGSANMGSFVVLPDAFPNGALWFVDLTSPTVTSDSA